MKKKFINNIIKPIKSPLEMIANFIEEKLENQLTPEERILKKINKEKNKWKKY